MPNIVGIRFKAVGKVYYFAPNDLEFELGDGVIVETARGVEYGKIVIANRDMDKKQIRQELKSVLRKATEKDDEQYTRNMDKKGDAIKKCQEKIDRHKLAMKLVDCEFTFDNSKVVFYFTAEGRVDFRDLVRDLASVFRTRIELRQIGIRDEAKIFGGIAPCGRICCCNQHLGDFEHVSIKMAKTQGLSLNPVKISGLCGRLMCCLSYENQYYSEVYKLMPKLQSVVSTPEGEGIVISNNMLKKIVKVRIQLPDKSFAMKDYPLDTLNVKETQVEDDGGDSDEIKSLLD